MRNYITDEERCGLGLNQLANYQACSLLASQLSYRTAFSLTSTETILHE